MIDLLRFAPLAVPQPAPPAAPPRHLGLPDFEGIDQQGACTCWAATAASLRKTFGRTELVTERDFAEAFWGSGCPEAKAQPALGWDRGVEDLACVLRVADLFDRALDTPPYLDLAGLLELLGSERVVLVLLAAGGGSHVVSVWSAVESEPSSWWLQVHDPKIQMGGSDRDPKGFLTRPAFTAAPPPPS